MNYPPIQQFRIWNPGQNQFVYSGGTPSMLSSFFNNTATLDTVHKIAYQRATGLHDKNGVEIYEGDILRMDVRTGPDEETDWSQLTAQITFESGAFWFQPITGYQLTDCRWFHYNAEDREVIGNVYENAELIEVA